MWISFVTSITKLDDFGKFLATNFVTKEAQISRDFLDYFENVNF